VFDKEHFTIGEMEDVVQFHALPDSLSNGIYTKSHNILFPNGSNELLCRKVTPERDIQIGICGTLKCKDLSFIIILCEM